MSKPKLITTNGLSFEAAMKRMIATPPLPKASKPKPATVKTKRKN
jgi:hypothetical protein